MSESPTAGYALLQNNSQGQVERINPHIIRANWQLPHNQPMRRNIPTNIPERPAFSIVDPPPPDQVQPASSEAIGVLPYSGTFYFTHSAALVAGPANFRNYSTQPCSQQMSYSSTGPTFSLGSRNQPEQQQHDFSFRSTNSNASSTIGPAPENRQTRPSPNVSASQSIPHIETNSARSTIFGACQVCYVKESNTMFLPC